MGLERRRLTIFIDRDLRQCLAINTELPESGISQEVKNASLVFNRSLLSVAKGNIHLEIGLNVNVCTRCQ